MAFIPAVIISGGGDDARLNRSLFRGIGDSHFKKVGLHLFPEYLVIRACRCLPEGAALYKSFSQEPGIFSDHRHIPLSGNVKIEIR